MADLSSDKDAVVRKEAIKLKGAQQWIVGSVGAVSLVAGTVAVFTRNVEAGPVALIAIGAIFSLIAIGGVLPSRLKIGENEAEFWQEVGEVIEQVIEQVPASSRAEMLARFATAAPEAIGPALRAAAYEEMVLEMVRGAVETMNASRQPADRLEALVPMPPGLADATVVDPLNGELAIEIKGFSKPVGPEMLRRILNVPTRRAASESGNHRTLFVSRSGLTTAAKAEIGRSDLIDTVEVVGPEDSRKLLTAIEQSLTLRG